MNCDGIGNTITISEDDKYINLSGIFYVDIVSPLSQTIDTGYYHVYQLIPISSLSPTRYLLPLPLLSPRDDVHNHPCTHHK